jgi:hypothetical protein
LALDPGAALTHGGLVVLVVGSGAELFLSGYRTQLVSFPSAGFLAAVVRCLVREVGVASVGRRRGAWPSDVVHADGSVSYNPVVVRGSGVGAPPAG